jgi:NAD(P)-dependent dehydrogenase (short-subunit alcohol dehydrogenase family)
MTNEVFPITPEGEQNPYFPRRYFDLSGKHALVTGATTDIARALAVALAEAGAKVSVTTSAAVDEQEVLANSILNECWAASGEEGKSLTLDLTDAPSFVEAIESLEKELGPVDVLVNAPHFANIKPVLDSSTDEWANELSRNATAVFVASQTVGRGMVSRGKGRIINLVSNLYDRGIPNCALFGASQGAVLGFTKSLGLEWGGGDPLTKDRVTVNALGIGFYEGVAGPQNDPNLSPVLEKYIPLRRLGRPEDLRGAVVYLASDEADYVNAELLVVDGSIVNHA